VPPGNQVKVTIRMMARKVAGLSNPLVQALTMQLKPTPSNHRDAMDTVRPGRNGTARSVWSAWSLLPLSDDPPLRQQPQVARTTNDSRSSSRSQSFAACEQFRLLPSQTGLSHLRIFH
jgi:hypothetical protein